MVTPPASYSPPPPRPPLSPYGTLNGCSLFQYHNNLVAIESAFDSSTNLPPLPNNKCIVLGGLSDGLLACPYVQELHQAIIDTSSSLSNNWSLVQPLLSSSYLGFGSGTLERDTFELDALLSYLTAHRSSSNSNVAFCLIGHSTGCQNIVHYLQHGHRELVDKVKLVVLQAPVSDREHLQTADENYEEHLRIATDLIEKDAESTMMPRSAFWAPITARRYYDLASIHGADDYFSSDLTDAELRNRLQHISSSACSSLRSLLCVFSGNDEYVPPSTVNKQELLERLCRAMNANHNKNDGDGVAKPLFLPLSNHNLSSNPQERQVFVDRVVDLLTNVGGVDAE